MLTRLSAHRVDAKHGPAMLCNPQSPGKEVLSPFTLRLLGSEKVEWEFKPKKHCLFCQKKKGSTLIKEGYVSTFVSKHLAKIKAQSQGSSQW